MQDQFGQIQSLKSCPICGRLFDGSTSVCNVDGYELVTQVGDDDPLIGTWLLDRYIVLSVLGAGGWARVYKARHLTLGTLVAIKTLHTHFLTNKEKVQRFEQEAKAACGLRHENIATIYDYGTLPNGQPFIIMDLLEGLSLQSLLDNEVTLEPKRAVNIFKQICSGLAAAHAEGIIHRDIKPSNIVLLPDQDRGELVKLFDFGLAKLKLEDGTSLNQFTKTGETVGTPAYMSPEQCQGWAVDHRTDIYSLGCVMYECLTGVKVFNGTTMYESMSKHVLEVAPPFSEAAPGIRIPARLEDIVFKAIEKEASKRYQTTRTLLFDLIKIENMLSSGANSTLQGIRLNRPWRLLQRTAFRYRRTAVLAATTMVLLFASCLLVYQSWREFDPSQMSLSDRWLFYAHHAAHALDTGAFKEALSSTSQSISVAERFSEPNRLRISLANQALLYHLTKATNQEEATDHRLRNLAQPSAAKDDQARQAKPGEVELLSTMLETIKDSKSTNQQQLLWLLQTINEIAPTTGDAKLVSLLQRACAVSKQQLGTSAPSYALSLAQLATALSLAGDHVQAFATWQECLPLLDKAISHTDPRYPTILVEAASELAQHQRYLEAEHYLLSAVKLQAKDSQLSKRTQSLSQLAALYAMEGKDDDAYEAWKSLLTLLDQNGAYENADQALNDLVQLSIKMRNEAATQRYLEERKDAVTAQYGRQSAGTAAYLLALAQLYLLEHRLPEAEQAAHQALDIRQVLYVPDSSMVASAISTLRDVYLSQSKYQQAAQLGLVATAIAQRNAESNQVMSDLSQLKQK